MAFVFKPVITKKSRDGRKVRRRAAYYWADYVDPTDGNQKRRALRLPSGVGITDKGVANEELRKLLARLQRKAAGLIDPAIESAGLPIRVVIARFARHLRGLRRTPKHIRLSIVRINALCERGEIAKLADVNEPNVSKALRSLSAAGRAPKTLNDHRASLYGLCQWAVKVERLIDRNPLETVSKAEPNGDAGKKRRALTTDEATRLLRAARRGRSLVYRSALLTGLRWGELEALQWSDLDLGAENPAIALRAATTKARRADTVLLQADLATRLKAARPHFARPSDRVFKTMPKYETFIRDCVDAGIVTLDENGRQVPDDRGRTVDRHALRTTFCTWLSMSGASPRTAQMLARHTDIRLTMRTYTDPRLLDGRSAIDAMPVLAEPQKATGTDGKAVVVTVVPDSIPTIPNRAFQFKNEGASKRRKNAESVRKSPCLLGNSQHSANGGGGNRTRVP